MGLGSLGHPHALLRVLRGRQPGAAEEGRAQGTSGRSRGKQSRMEARAESSERMKTPHTRESWGWTDTAGAAHTVAGRLAAVEG